VSDEHSFLLQRVQPAMVGLIDGSLSTLAPIFSVAIVSHKPIYAFAAGLATSIGGSPPPELGGGGGFTGEASWYGPGFAGQRTADGEIFDPSKLTCASPWLAFNTMLRVTDLETGRSVVVRVNDRGPYGRGVLDLSAHAAQIVGLTGWAEVQVEIL